VIDSSLEIIITRLKKRQNEILYIPPIHSPAFKPEKALEGHFAG
jgi:hypothetical protein